MVGLLLVCCWSVVSLLQMLFVLRISLFVVCCLYVAVVVVRCLVCVCCPLFVSRCALLLVLRCLLSVDCCCVVCCCVRCFFLSFVVGGCSLSVLGVRLRVV